MSEELLNNLVLMLEICSPVFTGLTILYFRLSSRIDKVESKAEVLFDSLRKEIQSLDHKMEQKFGHVEQRFVHMEQKLDYMERKFEQKFEKLDQKLDRLFEMLIIRNQLARGNPLKKTK